MAGLHKGYDRNIGRVFSDSAYDSMAIFTYAAGAEPVIKPKMNPVGQSEGSYVRAVTDFLSDVWKNKHRYGQRWYVKTVFSSLKRIVGEYFTYVLNVAIINEMMAKVYVYNTRKARRSGSGMYVIKISRDC
ncbi:MAG: hypothetical protein ACP5NC_01840 [Nitrososphaeria archaeon]